MPEEIQRGLSVVLPLYNGAAFVEGAILSVIGQTGLPDAWELIVVDDGSVDQGVARCRKLAEQHPQIIIERFAENRGVAAARNAGVRLARHEYLGFIDQDDRWLPNKWALQSKGLAELEGSYVFGHQRFELLDPDRPPHWFRSDWAHAPQPGYVLGAMLIRRPDFLSVGGLNETFRYGYDDVDWFIRARAHGLVETMFEDTVLHRLVHDANASSRTGQSTLELLRVIREKLVRQQ